MCADGAPWLRAEPVLAASPDDIVTVAAARAIPLPASDIYLALTQPGTSVSHYIAEARGSAFLAQIRAPKLPGRYRVLASWNWPLGGGASVSWLLEVR